MTSQITGLIGEEYENIRWIHPIMCYCGKLLLLSHLTCIILPLSRIIFLQLAIINWFFASYQLTGEYTQKEEKKSIFLPCSIVIWNCSIGSHLPAFIFLGLGQTDFLIFYTIIKSILSPTINVYNLLFLLSHLATAKIAMAMTKLCFQRRAECLAK